MKKSTKIILGIVSGLILILLGTRIGSKSDAQWDMNCGFSRGVKTQCYGIFCQQTSETIDENYFSKYWEKTHGKCTEHSWRNYHGRGNFLLNRYSYSGYRPFWLFGPVWETAKREKYNSDYLGFLYQHNPNLIKEVLEHMLDLEKSRISDRDKKYSYEQYEYFKEEFENFMVKYSPENKNLNQTEEFDKFKSWWELYKNKYSIK